MSIGICIISRSRPEQLKRCIDSFRDNQYKGDVFFYIGVDSDDPLKAAYNQIEDSHTHIIDLGISNNKPNMGRMWNTLASKCPCDILGVFGDDVICETMGWDKAVKLVAEKHSDGIFMCWGCDGLQDGRLATHPFVGRKYFDIMGEMFPNELIVDYSDVYVHKVFDGLCRAYFMPFVTFRHNHPIKTRQPDALFLRNRMCVPEATKAWERVSIRIPATITKIQHYMEGYKP